MAVDLMERAESIGNLILLSAAAVVAVSFMVQPAAFGRFSANATLVFSGKWSWFLFESVPLLSFMSSFLTNPDLDINIASATFFALFVVHYINRAVIYVIRAASISPASPFVTFSAVVFNLSNGFANGTMASSPTTVHRIHSPSFYLGVILFLYGMHCNITADNHLISLRSGSRSGKDDCVVIKKNGKDSIYRIPTAGWFKYVTSANYWGESLEWLGWAIATWNLAGLAFFVFTISNLWTRAWFVHKWYKKTFPMYPRERRAVVPFLL